MKTLITYVYRPIYGVALAEAMLKERGYHVIAPSDGKKVEIPEHIAEAQALLQENGYCVVPMPPKKGRINHDIMERVGTLVAVPNSYADTYTIGWSKCRLDMDVFNKHMGKFIALRRAAARTSFYRVPADFRKDLAQFLERCEKYFKHRTLDPAQSVLGTPHIPSQSELVQ